jgi:hypothetical protein
MKRAFFVFFAFILALGTPTVFAWEGTATIAPGGDLPGGGFSIATNSFPVNTTVEVINLENGKIVRVNVVSGLNTMGLMATLSREAAEAINLYGNSSCRIRMSQSSHEISISQLKLGPVVNPLDLQDGPEGVAPSDSPENSRTASETSIAQGEYAADTPIAAASTGTAGPADISPANSAGSADIAPVISSTPLTEEGYPSAISTVNPVQDEVNNIAKTDVNPVFEFDMAINIAEGGDFSEIFIASGVSPETEDDSAYLSSADTPTKVDEGYSAFDYITSIILYPSGERIPEASNRSITPEFLAPPLRNTEYTPPADFSPFQVPLISRLERGKYYVQVAAYARPDNVEDEINRIGKSFPLAIQNIGTDSNPLFRVLLGPLNQSESFAMLQRFKSIGYADAFVWRN